MALLCSEAEKSSSSVSCETMEVSSSDSCQNPEKSSLPWDSKQQELLSGPHMLLTSLFEFSKASKWLFGAWEPQRSSLISESCKSRWK